MPGVFCTKLPAVGDVILMMDGAVCNKLPVGTILEAESEAVATVAYKVTDKNWTFTGFSNTMTNLEMVDITNKSMEFQWLVVRMGEHEDVS